MCPWRREGEGSVIRRPVGAARVGRTRLMIVDDHELARAGLRHVLAPQRDLKVVGEAANGREAVALCRQLRPDLVLIDVRMPGMDGLTATRLIKESCPEASVIIVTMFENPEYLSEALKAGATGYILKDATHREVLAAVRQVARGESVFSPRAMSQLRRRMGAGAPGADRPATGALTPREREVLELLVLGHTNRQIAQALVISRGTAKSHVERIIAKLGATDRTAAAVKAVRLGLVSPEPES
jgi:DNA-binding NarL/FixJ family response regulator